MCHLRDLGFALSAPTLRHRCPLSLTLSFTGSLHNVLLNFNLLPVCPLQIQVRTIPSPMVSYPGRIQGEGRVKAFLPHSSTFLSADVYTLRKRGLLVAAVLFITGIVILTSENGHWVGGAPRLGGRRPWGAL